MMPIWAALLGMTYVFLGTALYTKDRTYLIYANIYAAASLLAVGMIQ